jgi:hypothetical protein
MFRRVNVYYGEDRTTGLALQPAVGIFKGSGMGA